MIVQELIEELSNYNPGALVLMASDAEGNSINMTDEISTSIYLKEEGITRDFTLVHPDDVGSEYDEEALSGIDAVVIWPY